ncbi:hypothetical protein [uncultured Eubacterium sp.]|uniref:hypothetical protein n=1 Tax=uncultured Eubacterium sp. TaxID=165185 RepID=UPI0025E6F34B|nr:hypothetical protein [uncultured Eubacterium sp.]
MNLIKEWTFCICSTVIVSVIFSLLAPKGGSGRFYKSVISLFIFVSFLFPFTQIGDKKLDFNLDNINIEAENNTNSIAEGVVKNEIITLLENNSVYSAGVNCSSSVNADNEIMLNSVTVSVADEYDCDTVRQLIYDELSLNVRVIHIGE